MTPQLAGATIGIGVVGPLSGVAEQLGAEMKQAAEMAVEECNAAGGVSGAYVLAESVDDASDVHRSEIVARHLSERSNLLGIVGHYSSDTTLAAAKIYKANELVVVSPIASNPELTDSGLGNVFRYTNRDDRTGRAIAEYVYRQLSKRQAAVVITDSAYGRSMASAFIRSFAELGGQILVRLVVQQGNRDFGPLVGRLPQEFDLLFYGGSFEGAAIVKSLRAAGLSQLVATGDGCWDVHNFLRPVGDAAMEGEGVLILSATPEVGRVSGSGGFAQRYEQRFGPIGNYAVNSYDSTQLLLRAVEQAAATRRGVPNRTEVAAAVQAMRFEGIAYPGTVRWDSRGDNLAAVTALHIVENGRFRQIAQIGNGMEEA